MKTGPVINIRVVSVTRPVGKTRAHTLYAHDKRVRHAFTQHLMALHAPPDAFVLSFTTGLLPTDALFVMSYMLKGRTYEELPLSGYSSTQRTQVLALASQIDKMRFMRRASRTCLELQCEGTDTMQLYLTFGPIDPRARAAVAQMNTPPPPGKKLKTDSDHDGTPHDSSSGASATTSSGGKSGGSSASDPPAVN